MRRAGWKAAALAGLAGLLGAACARPTATPDSGVAGRVWVGPMCPVVQPGVPCPDQPLEADLEVSTEAGRVVARVRSDREGAYQIALPAGRYVLTPLSPGASGLPYASPIPIEVPAGGWLPLDIHYDSGLR